MPVTYARDDARRLITVTLCGRFTGDDLVATIQRQAVEGTWSYRTLIDAREAPPPSSADVRRIRTAVDVRNQQYGRRGAVVLVVAPDSEVAYGMGRMYELSSDDPTFHVVRVMSEAESWLAIQRAT